MSSFARLAEAFAAFMNKGGGVMWAIFAATLVLWTLILERYYYMYRVFPGDRDDLIRAWTRRPRRRGREARRIREASLAEADARLQRGFALMRGLAAVLPMLGLLGTIAGMMNTFEVMSVAGTGSARGMAGGISQALITTMAGLVSALSGVYFIHHLGHRADLMRQALADRLDATTVTSR